MLIGIVVLVVLGLLIVRCINAESSEETRVLTAVYSQDFELDEPYQHQTNGRRGSKARQGRWRDRDN